MSSQDIEAPAEAELPRHSEKAYLLRHLAGEKPSAPDWFGQALAAETQEGFIDVDGAAIAWRAWGRDNTDKPGLVFVHGGLAHKGWWDFIAPFFAEHWRPVAMDLSGMGASSHRDEYRMETYVTEVMEAAQAAGAFASGVKPVLVGHSFGGMVAVAAAATVGHKFAAMLVMDTPIFAPPERREEGSSPPKKRGGRMYKSQTDALARFRLLPEQPCENDYVIDHIARGALHPVTENGDTHWTWAHDPNLWIKLQRPDQRDPVAVANAAKCPLAFVRGDKSALVTPPLWASMIKDVGAGRPMITVPDARHHLFLDQPLATIALLEGVLAAWPEVRAL